MSDRNIYYSDKYFDTKYEYRHVHLPKDLVAKMPKHRLMTEREWRGLGIQQSIGWVHYMIHEPEPHIILFRRSRTDLPDATSAVPATSGLQAQQQTFERVLVQNILHGLPPLVCEAIQSISRWNMVRFALPHVLHCTAAMLRQRLKHTSPTATENISGHDDGTRFSFRHTSPRERPLSRAPLKFDQAETKLLYTLQWMLLDASSECADNDTNFKNNSLRERAYLHDLATLQLFIYLFTPVIERLQCSDFDTLKLESGLRLWMPLFAFRQPYEGSFPVPVKPCGEVRINPLRSYIEQFGPLPEPFQRSEDLNTTAEPSTEKTAAFVHSFQKSSKSNVALYLTSPNLNIPNAESSDEDNTWYCKQDINAALKSHDAKNSVPMARLNDICPISLKDMETSGETTTSDADNSGFDHSDLDKSLEEEVEAFTEKVLQNLMATDTKMASHCDLAVMRCLFSPEWSESGAYWSLQYIFRRLTYLRREFRQEQVKISAECRMQHFRARLSKVANNLGQNANMNYGDELGTLRSLSMPHLVAPISSDTLSCYQSNESVKVTLLPLQKPHNSCTSPRRPKNMFTIGEMHPISRNAVCSMKQSSSLSQKSSSSEQLDTMGLLNVTNKPSPVLTFTNSHSSFTDGKISSGSPTCNTAIESLPHSLPSHQPSYKTPFTSSEHHHHSGGGMFSRKRSKPVELGKSKRLAVFEIKDRFIRLGKGRGDATHSSSQLHEDSIKPQLPEEFGSVEDGQSISGAVGSLLCVPGQQESLTSSCGILRTMFKQTYPKSAVDLVELHGPPEQDSGSSMIRFKSQTLLTNEKSCLFGSGVKITGNQTPMEAGSQSSIDLEDSSTTLNQQNPRSSIHRSHTDTNIAYHSMQQVEEVSGSNYYIEENGEINFNTLLRGIYWTSNLHASSRICEYLIKCILCLMDLCPIKFDSEKMRPTSRKSMTPRRSDNISSTLPTAHQKNFKIFSSRSKSFASSTIPIVSNCNIRSAPRICGRTLLFGHDVEDQANEEKLGKSRLRSFERQHQHRRAEMEEHEIFNEDHLEDENSSDEDNSLHRIPSFHARLKPTNIRTYHKHMDRQQLLNLDNTQVRFLPSTQPQKRMRNHTGKGNGQGEKNEIVDSVNSNIAPIRFLTNGMTVVEKRPKRCNNEGKSNPVRIVFEKTAEELMEKKQRATTNYCLIMEILVKVIRILSCSQTPLGGQCKAFMGQLAFDHRETSAKYIAMLRRHVHECLLKMFHLNEQLFYCFFSRLIAAVPITELLEFLHALTGFCQDPLVGVCERSGHDSGEKCSYQNNFGQSYTGEGTRGAEGIIISNMMGPLLRRFVRCRRELATQENISLFTEVRHLLAYLKAVHGNTFRRALLSTLLCSVQTVPVKHRNITPTPRPRLLSARNSLWPTASCKRPSMIAPSGIQQDDLVVGGCQNKKSVTGQTWISRNITEESANSHSDAKTKKMSTDRKLIDLPSLKEDLRDFSFLIDCSEPGTLPEPQLVASFLDLNAPVLARACLFLECAYFVNKCNRGEWPTWMKMNFPMPMQQSAVAPQQIAISVSAPSGSSQEGDDEPTRAGMTKQTCQIQWAAGKLFHGWAEALGIRLHFFLENQKNSETFLIHEFGCEENFLDDASVNPSGDACPYALLVLAVQLLMEITTFLREYHQHASKAQTSMSKTSEQLHQSDYSSAQSHSITGARKSHVPIALSSATGGAAAAFKSTRRRLSILMPIFGPGEMKDKSHNRENSAYIELSNLKNEDSLSKAEDDYSLQQGQQAPTAHSSRQISFALSDNQRERRASLQGSLSSLEAGTELVEKANSKSISKNGSKRRSRSGSFRQSFQISSLINTARSGRADGSFRRISTRIGGSTDYSCLKEEPNVLDEKIPPQSESTAALGLRPESAGKASLRLETDGGSVLDGGKDGESEDFPTHQLTPQKSINKRSPRRDCRKTSVSSNAGAYRGRNNAPVDNFSSNMPWIASVIQFAKLTTFGCKHHPNCEANCFDRQQQQLRNLVQAIRQVYSANIESSFIHSVDELPDGRRLYRPGQPAVSSSSGTGGDPAVTHQNSSDSGRTSEITAYVINEGTDFDEVSRTSDDSHSPATADSSDEIDANGELSELNLRLAMGAGSGLRIGGLNGDLGNSCVDAELDTSTSILHRVFGGGGGATMDGDKKSVFFTRNNKRKESGWREVTTPLLDRLRRKAGPNRVSGLGDATNYRGSDGGAPGGFLSQLNLSILAGAGTGLSAAPSSPSLARLLEVVRGGLGSTSFEADEPISDEESSGKINKRPSLQATDSPELAYLDTQVQSLRSSFFNLLNKSAILLTNDQLEDIIPLAWDLLLEADPELASSAATLVLFGAVKCPSFIQKLLYMELQHKDMNNRLNAVLRFRVLWSARQQVWSRLEEGASQYLKVPPPLIEYVLPSPTLGNPTVEVPDPAWQTRKGTSAEEVQLKQNEATKTFVTASTSRRKQQAELLARALVTANTQREEARRAFHLTTCSLLELAATEAVFFFSKDHRTAIAAGEEAQTEDTSGCGMNNSVVQEEFNLAARKVSFAPLNRSINLQSRSFSWRNGSIPMFRDNVTLLDVDDDFTSASSSVLLTQQLQMAQVFFPSCLSAAAIPLTNLLDDSAVNSEGTAINTVVQQVIWQCLLEDTSLFLRYIFEKLTRVPHKDELIFVLRKLVQRLPELPMQTAHILFNNLIGCIMFHVRTPSFDAPDSIASILCVLHMIVPFVKNIYFKDLKQTLRREQVDSAVEEITKQFSRKYYQCCIKISSTLLLTANLPCAKQFNVFDDSICVAQLVKLQDDNKDYRFSDILSEALEMNGVPSSEHHLHVLCDDRSNIIRNSSHYVRDFYPFKRNHIPKLKLMRVDRATGQQLLQQNAFSLKVQELSKVLLMKTILQTTSNSHLSNHLLFLREELGKLPSFPRKALEAEFTLYESGDMGKPLLAMDTIHKLTWCQLLNSMFQKMPSTFPWSSELQLFLNVYNGTLILHAEDSTILRHCMAFYIQCCYQFKMIFSVNGYLSIIPTIIRVYHHYQHNSILTQAIEFTCKHFYIMHRTPFILQMLGSIANYIDLNPDQTSPPNFYRILPETIYKLLRSIGRDLPDILGILQLCGFTKPLKALDFCYADDSTGWSILEAVNLCVTVQVYAPESYRSRQMMIILQAILPFILRDLTLICNEEWPTSDAKKTELQAIQQLSVMIKQLIFTTEGMTRRTDDSRSIVPSQSNLSPGGPRGTSVKHLVSSDQTSKLPEWATAMSGATIGSSNNQSCSAPLHHEQSLTSNEGFLKRRQRSGSTIGLRRSASAMLNKRSQQEISASTVTPSGWLKASIEPREAVLQIASEFLTVANRRLTEIGEKQRSTEMLDGKAYMRLSELVQSIIKQFPSNPTLLKSQSLQRFFMEVLPIVDWGHESLRSCKALETLVGRLNRTLPKMLDNAAVRKQVSWKHVTNVVRSLYLTVQRNRTVAQMKEIKLFVDYLKRSIVIGSNVWYSSEKPAGTSSFQLGGYRDTTDLAAGTPSTPGVSFLPELVSDRSNSTMGIVKRRLPRVGISSTSCHNKESQRLSSISGGSNPTDLRSIPPTFASESVKLIALMLSSLGPNYRLKDVCERTNMEFVRCPTILEGGAENLSNYLAYLILPLLFHCNSTSGGRSEFPNLSKDNVFYALDICLSALFIGAQKTLSSTSPDIKHASMSAQVKSSHEGASGATDIQSNTSKLGLPSNFIMSNARLGSGLVGLAASDTRPGMAGAAGVTSLLQLPGLLGGGQPVVGSNWELVGPSSLACDLGGGRAHGVMVNLVSPTLHCLQHRNQAITGNSLTTNCQLPKLTTFNTDSATKNCLEKNIQSQIDVVHKLAFLGLKLVLIVFPRHGLARSRQIVAVLAKLSAYRCCGVQMWKFFDFICTYRPSIFTYLAPFLHFQLLNVRCETQGELAFQQIIGQKLLGLHLPPRQTIVSLLKELLLDLRILREEKQMLYILRQKTALQVSPRHGAEIKRSSTLKVTDPAGNVAAHPGILRHASEKHVGVLGRGHMQPFSQTDFRQSLLRRTSGKRISAHDGSRFLSHHRTFSQRKPILTASVESLPRQSCRHMSSEIRQTTCGKSRVLKRAETTAGMVKGSSDNADYLEKQFKDVNLSTVLKSRMSSEDEMNELNATANPTLAAAVAKSLYGSSAPYVRVREKAREELNDLIGNTDSIPASNCPVYPNSSSRKMVNPAIQSISFVRRGPFHDISQPNLSPLQKQQPQETDIMTSIPSLAKLPLGVESKIHSSTPAEKEQDLCPQARVQYI